MPQRNKDHKATIIGLVLIAIVVGALIGFQVYNPFPPPPPGPPKVDLNMGYDDEWGKLNTPETPAVVTHILVSWTGKSAGVKLKQARTRDEAKTLIEDIWARYKNEPTEANWTQLQKHYNEDTTPHNKYTCTADASLDKPFKECGMTTKKNHARIIEGAYGFHLIRREG